MRYRTGIALTIALCLARPASAATTNVTSAAELRTAIGAAQPGTTIHLAPGAYALDAALATNAAGTAAQPITLTSDKASGVRLDFSSTDGLVVAHAYWVVDGVWFNGTCSACAATGLRVRPGGDHLVVHSSRFTNFATAVKGERAGDAEPADATLDTNEFFNAAQLPGGGTPVDIVGGQRWHLIGNYIHDYTGSGKHPAIALSGGATDALIERNLVVGSKDSPPGGTSLAFSLGGITPSAMCATANRGAASCTCEVLMGKVHNNIVVRTTGHGLLLSRACGTAILLNTVYATVPGLEIAAPGPTGTLDVRFNVMSGSMGGIMAALNKDNVSAAMFKSCYKDPDNFDFTRGPDDKLINDLQPAISEVVVDYLGDPRNATLDWGAVELKAGARPTWPWAGTALIGAGMGPPGGGVVATPDGGAGGMPAGGAGVGGAGVAGAVGGSSLGQGGSGGGGGSPDSVGAGGTPGGGTTGTGGHSPTDTATGAGATAPSSSGGCAYRVAAPSSPAHRGAALLLLAIVVASGTRRRRPDRKMFLSPPR